MVRQLTLQTLVKGTPGYTEDSRDILYMFKWITYDVKSLYTSIPRMVALMALKFHLDARSNYTVDLKEFIL